MSNSLKRKVNTSLVNVSSLQKLLFHCHQDFSLSFPVYIFHLCKYLCLYAFALHILM